MSHRPPQPPTQDALTAALAALIEPVVERAVAKVLAEFDLGRAATPALLDRAHLAQALDVSLATLDRMRERGQLPPAIMLGDSPRWRLDAVLAHLQGAA